MSIAMRCFGLKFRRMFSGEKWLEFSSARSRKEPVALGSSPPLTALALLVELRVARVLDVLVADHRAVLRHPPLLLAGGEGVVVVGLLVGVVVLTLVALVVLVAVVVVVAERRVVVVVARSEVEVAFS